LVGKRTEVHTAECLVGKRTEVHTAECLVGKRTEVHTAECLVWKRTEVHTAECLVGKPEGSRQFGRLRRRCETNNKMDLTEIEREGIFWISLAQLAGCRQHGNESPGFTQCLEFLS